jgi:hypothetical protein
VIAHFSKIAGSRGKMDNTELFMLRISNADGEKSFFGGIAFNRQFWGYNKQ